MGTQESSDMLGYWKDSKLSLTGKYKNTKKIRSYKIAGCIVAIEKEIAGVSLAEAAFIIFRNSFVPRFYTKYFLKKLRKQILKMRKHVHFFQAEELGAGKALAFV